MLISNLHIWLLNFEMDFFLYTQNNIFSREKQTTLCKWFFETKRKRSNKKHRRSKMFSKSVPLEKFSLMLYLLGYRQGIENF